MSRELRSVLILFVLMIVIWTITFMATRPSSAGAIGLLLLIGSLWATADFLRALWRFLRARNASREDEAAG